MQYVNRATGIADTAYGNSTGYELRADGTYVFAGLLRQSFNGCTTTVFNYRPGKYEVTGKTIVFTPTENYLKYTDSCVPSTNSEKNKPLEEQSFEYKITVSDDGREYLCLTTADGKEYRLPKSRD